MAKEPIRHMLSLDDNEYTGVILMKNYVISLKTATDRREHIINEFGKQNIKFEFFDAVTSININNICAQLDLENLQQTNNLTNGEKGCFLSHVALWQKMLDDNLEWVAIFEDDVYLGQNAHLLLNSHDWLPEDIKLLKLEHFHSPLKLGHCIKTIQNRTIYPLYSANIGAAGYIIHQSVIKSLFDMLRHTKISHIKPLDHFLFEDTLDNHINIFQLSPALCIQSSRLIVDNHLKSSIESERSARMRQESNSRTFIEKIKREQSRLLQQISKKLNKTQPVEFQ
ncbi:glycosyltransferase family 25 protein [Moraxella oblonga]|uniref:glycosyltransferase family 25 protein n=1 Tax=Moraxella oblonga TaxID=200413 RepID=UPI0008321995|nr:glycosyltransferase family 25 protein [Moraxella oblonga]